jgi:hypothetical protein
MTKLLTAAVALALCGCVSVVKPVYEPKWGPFTGRIVDADTGEPIRGAVAYAVWMQPILSLHAQERLYDARFAVSNDEGMYTIAARHRPLSPIPATEGPYLEWAAPRYQPVSFDREADGTFVIGMRQWARLGERERWYYLHTGRITDDLRRDMLKRINAARRGMGLLPMTTLEGATW